ncbi:MAG: hypothetical protein JWO31_4303 [Phycisphaerales bacterium]|nr:hypothetical protein [Phycisphaerales bacterium]
MSCLSLANAISIGFRSGEYGGRNSSDPPRALGRLAAPGALWLERSCITTMSPRASAGKSTWATNASNAPRSTAPPTVAEHRKSG